MTERDSRETERRGVIRVRPSGAEDKGEGEKIEWIWGLGFQPLIDCDGVLGRVGF